MPKKPIFEVDVKGLRDLIEDAGPARLIQELISNAFDEDNVTEVVVSCGTPIQGAALITVTDDAPEGFADLAHSYTLFAESYKKTNPEKGGRFNIGEKLFLAAALLTRRPVAISTTTGSIFFDLREGRTHAPRERRTNGSEISGWLRMTAEQHAATLADLRRIIPPAGIRYTVNGAEIPHRDPIAVVDTVLMTLLTDGEGVLRAVRRKTRITVLPTLDGEEAYLYELGIPVVPTGDRYHYDIAQKVPLGMSRDNVPPNFLRAVRTAVFNATHRDLPPDEGNAAWVREALADQRVDDDAVRTALDLRFTPKRVAFDPSDPESNKQAVAAGFQVVHGRHLSPKEWENAKRAGAITPAGQVFPTRHAYEGGPGSPTVTFIEPDRWTPGMRRVADFCEDFHRALFGTPIIVRIVQAENRLNHFGACYLHSNRAVREASYPVSYGDDEVHFNLWKLGHDFFDHGITHTVVELVVHEFGHVFCADHLNEKYHGGLCAIAAKIALDPAVQSVCAEYGVR